MKPPKVPLGTIYITPASAAAIAAADVRHSLAAHSRGIWGELDDDDRRANDARLLTGGPLISAWSDDLQRWWIITEGDRSRTTVLLPEEY